MKRLSVILAFFALIALFSCQKQEVLTHNEVATFLSPYAHTEQLPDGSLMLSFPDTLQVIGITDDNHIVYKKIIKLHCKCITSGTCSPFYVPSLGQGGCATDDCEQCNMSITTGDNTHLKYFALRYKPSEQNKFIYLGFLAFMEQDWDATILDSISKMTPASLQEIESLNPEQVAAIFPAPEKTDEPFYLYPVSVNGHAAYVMTSRITLPGDYIPVASIKKAKYIGCNGNCKLDRAFQIITCRDVCGDCTLEIEQ